MSTRHDPQHPPGGGGGKAADGGGLAESARQAQAIRAASDTSLLETLAVKQAQHLQNAPEVAIEAELARRGYHYDPDRGVWEK
jgi:hypothetical protein